MTKDTGERVSPLRQRMIDSMRIAGHADSTQREYLRAVLRLSDHYGRSPDRLSAEQIKAYVAQRIGEGLKPRTTNVIVAAFKVFYRNALGKPELVDGLGTRPKKELLPRPIAPEDVERLIHATFDLRCRSALVTGYGAGLRIAEVVALQVEDVRSKEGLLRIRKGKGGHERMAHCPKAVLDQLRRYWRTIHPHPATWLFYGARPEEPMTAEALRQAFNAARDRVGLDRSVTFPCLRHSMATHIHERGAPITVVQDALGHRSVESTRVYARTTGSMFKAIEHPVSEFRLG